MRLAYVYCIFRRRAEKRGKERGRLLFLNRVLIQIVVASWQWAWRCSVIIRWQDKVAHNRESRNIREITWVIFLALGFK